MSKIFKPRRGKASTMLGTKASTVLAAGEMFIELPDTGVGTGICKMKMGDGVTAYSSLPYAMGGDIASTEITGSIVEDTSATAAAALANVTTGRTLGAIVGSLRRACQLNAQSIATLNDESSAVIPLASGISAYSDARHMVYKIGKICMIKLYLEPFTIPALWSAITLGTVPNGYRPKVQLNHMNYYSPSVFGLTTVNTEGQITFQNCWNKQGDTTSNFFGFNIAYIHA